MMPLDQSLRDDKKNLVVVTLFESRLAKFIVEHPAYYQSICIRLLDAIEALLDDEEGMQPYIEHKTGSFDLDRYIFTVFSRLDQDFPGYKSFNALKENFKIQPMDFFVKILADELFIDKQSAPAFTIRPSVSGVFAISVSGSRSPENPDRNQMLFSDENRGVVSLEDEDNEEPGRDSFDLGIVDPEHVPSDLKSYFHYPVEGARFLFSPNEESYVAQWLRDRSLPVIAGASGSTEKLFSRIFPMLASLSVDDKRMLVFAQACNMVASGRHSLFESMLVADSFDLKLEDTDDLLDFYLQCIPDVIRHSPDFQAFLNSDEVKPLLQGMPLYDDYDYQDDSESDVGSAPGF